VSDESVPVLSTDEVAELRAEPRMVHTFDAYRIVALLLRSTSRDSGVRHEHSTAKCADCRALAYNPGLDAALNSGDGAYKP
jgi:hypothetical protein